MSKIIKQYGFLWVTLGFFAISLTGHWFFGWLAYVDEQTALNQPRNVDEYVIEISRDMFENWQSEFLQLIWQVAGLAMLLHVGSPASKEGDDRMEAKLDKILFAVDPNGRQIVKEIDDNYEGRHTDPYYPGNKDEGERS